MRRRSVISAIPLGVFGFAGTSLVSSPRHSTDVAVIGGGLAGLNAARICAAAGRDVTLLEARERCGGRMMTTESAVGLIELGAVEVGDNYARFLALAKSYQVDLVAPKSTRIPGLCLHLDGRNLADSDWAAQPQVAEVKQALRVLPPNAWLAFWLGKQTHLQTVADWTLPAMQSLDVSLREYLKTFASATDLELRLAEVASNYSDFSKTSALDVLRRDVMRKAAGSQVKTLAVGGGSQALPLAIAAALSSKIDMRYGDAGLVLSVMQKRGGFIVRTANGLVDAKKVILALPATVFSTIATDVFSAQDSQTLRPLWQRPMTPVTTLHFAPKSAFWEQDGLSPNMWIDGPLERLFAVADADLKVQRLLVWINGRAALALDTFAPSERRRFVELELARVRPSCLHQLDYLTEKSWSADPLTTGAYAEIPAGQCSKVHAAATYAKTLKRIAFAGEHTVFDLPGMEAALASGERAAAQILGF